MLLKALLFFAYALLNTAAMAAIKEACPSFSTVVNSGVIARLALGALLYAAAIGVLVVLLKRGDASSVFPIAIGCTVLATNALGAHRYGERITARKLGGTALLLAGITITFMEAGHA